MIAFTILFCFTWLMLGNAKFLKLLKTILKICLVIFIICQVIAITIRVIDIYAERYQKIKEVAEQKARNDCLAHYTGPIDPFACLPAASK